MSYFLCLAIPETVSESAFRAAFDQSIWFTAVTDCPIGKITCGKRINDKRNKWRATFLQIGFCSAKLIGKGAIKKTHNNDKSPLLIAGLQRLLADENCPSVCFLGHWMQGSISEEEFLLRGQEQIIVAQLPEVLERLEEDTRYVLFQEPPWRFEEN